MTRFVMDIQVSTRIPRRRRRKEARLIISVKRRGIEEPMLLGCVELRPGQWFRWCPSSSAEWVALGPGDRISFDFPHRVDTIVSGRDSVDRYFMYHNGKKVRLEP